MTGKPPYFSDIVGASTIIERMRRYRGESDMPHAFLLVGDEGGEAFPLAMATARFLQCETPSGEDACGHCRSCKQFDELAHPDVFFSFPVFKGDGGSDESTSDTFMEQFRTFWRDDPRPTLQGWRQLLKSGNKRLQMYRTEGDRLLHKLQYRAIQSDRRVVVMWAPELMNSSCANALLKLIEEPPQGVVFIFCSSAPQDIMPTIYSRLQRVRVAPVETEPLEKHLINLFDVSSIQAHDAAHFAKGNFGRAIDYLSLTNQQVREQVQAKEAGTEADKRKRVLELLDIAVKGNPLAMRDLAEEIHKWPREEVIMLLDAIPFMLREINAITFGDNNILYLLPNERDEVRRLSTFFTVSNLPLIMQEVLRARYEVFGNGNVRIIFFDFLITVSRIFRQ